MPCVRARMCARVLCFSLRLCSYCVAPAVFKLSIILLVSEMLRSEVYTTMYTLPSFCLACLTPELTSQVKGHLLI